MFISRKSLRILPLILFLLAGQLQAAKTVITCSMMGESIQNATMDMQDVKNCHHDHKTCLNLDCDDSANPNTDSCFIKIVVLNSNQDVQLNTPVSDLVIESDIDPPQESVGTYHLIFQLQTEVHLRIISHTNYSQAGSKIHLITQRLRI